MVCPIAARAEVAPPLDMKEMSKLVRGPVLMPATVPSSTAETSAAISTPLLEASARRTQGTEASFMRPAPRRGGHGPVPGA